MASIPAARLDTLTGRLLIDYAYRSEGEQRAGQMQLMASAKTPSRYEGSWRTEATNGNTYAGDLYLDFAKDGSAEGEYTFGGASYEIGIRWRE